MRYHVEFKGPISGEWKSSNDVYVGPPGLGSVSEAIFAIQRCGAAGITYRVVSRSADSGAVQVVAEGTSQSMAAVSPEPRDFRRGDKVRVTYETEAIEVVGRDRPGGPLLSVKRPGAVAAKTTVPLDAVKLVKSAVPEWWPPVPGDVIHGWFGDAMVAPATPAEGGGRKADLLFQDSNGQRRLCSPDKAEPSDYRLVLPSASRGLRHQDLLT
jgi:hypothetical protein